MKTDKHGAYKIGVFAFIVGLIAAALLFRVLGVIGVLLALPILAFGISRLLVDHTHSALAQIGDSYLEQWEGKYYEFATMQIRIYEVDGQLWFALGDIIRATGLKTDAHKQLAAYPNGCEVLAGTGGLVCMTAPTVEKFIERHPGQETGRFLLWMQRSVLLPYERKKKGQVAKR
jgi:hypothetical protein